MRKILCIMQLPPPVHGASLMNSYLAKSTLIKNCFKLQIINLQFSSSQQDIEKFSILKIFKSFYYAGAIFYKVLRFKPELTYFTLSATGYGFYRDILFVSILKLFKKRIIFHLHGKGIKNESQKNLINSKIYKFVFKNVNVICLANNLVDDIRPVYSSDPFIVPCGIPIHSKSLQKINKSEKIVRILYLSNYIENKGILKLIDALDILHRQGLIFNTRLVGAPTDLTVEEINGYVKKRGLEECVHTIGPKYGEEKFREFTSADIFAFPTFYPKEAFPLVNLEAMQFSLPVISTNEGGISEAVINEVTGFLVEPKNVEQLAEKLKILILNEKLREQMGRNGRCHFLKNFTIDHYEHNIKNAFDAVLRKQNSLVSNFKK